MQRKQVTLQGCKPVNLTAPIIEKLKPGQKVWDVSVPGLYAQRMTNVTLMRLKYYDKYNKARVANLGTFGAIDVAKARSVAVQYLFALARGADPLDEMARNQGTPTIMQVSIEYMRDEVIPNRKRPEEYERIFANYIRPELGVLKIDELTYDHLTRFMGTLRRKPVTANMAKRMLVTMYKYAARRQMVPFTFRPWLGVKLYKEAPRRRYATPEEMRRIADILIAKQAEAPRSVAFILLLIMTGARKSEIANATLNDLVGNRLELKDSKTGFRVVHLSDLMVELVNKLPRVEGDKRLVGIRTPEDCWDKIRKQAGCPDLRLHDLRHSFASQGLAAGLTLDVIGQLLGHTSTRTTQRYAHLVDDKAKTAVAETTSIISAMMGGAAERIVAAQDAAKPLPNKVDIYSARKDIPDNFKQRLLARRKEELEKRQAAARRLEKVRKRKLRKAEKESQ